MSTRSCIAIRRPSGKYSAIYCHSDGYLSFNGYRLMRYYHGVRAAASLFQFGDMSSLGIEIGQKHDFDWTSEEAFSYGVCKVELSRMTPEEQAEFDNNAYTYAHFKRTSDIRNNWCRFYARDRKYRKGEDHTPIFGDFNSYAELRAAYDDSMCEYMYLFAGGTWWTDAYWNGSELILLYDALARWWTEADAGDKDRLDWRFPITVGPAPLLRGRARREGYGGPRADTPGSRIIPASEPTLSTTGRRPIML